MSHGIGSGLTVIGLLALLAAPSAAQGAPARAGRHAPIARYRKRVLGVFDAATGLPVPNADVIDVLTGTAARTSRTGTVVLRLRPTGGAVIRIRKLGYALRTMVVASSPADTAPVTVVLQPAVQLPEVRTYGQSDYISPNLRDFEERKRMGFGYYLDEAQLRKEEDRPLGNVLLSHFPGVQIVDAGPHMYLGPSDRCSGAVPDVYLDGVRVLSLPRPTSALRAQLASGKGPPTRGPIDLSQFGVWNLAGVEYYPDDAIAPMEYAGTSKGCGVLLLWTREK
ncbi:MAG TPA: hypothetical protein VFW98_00995 [Gemmatimonadaceae bacterium]|nr:hypothetical protein [Gemmatimonadaceae bacterium]